MGFTGSFSGLLNPNLVPLLDSFVVDIRLYLMGFLFLIYFDTAFGTAL
jgi:high-affinity nickel permease